MKVLSSFVEGDINIPSVSVCIAIARIYLESLCGGLTHPHAFDKACEDTRQRPAVVKKIISNMLPRSLMGIVLKSKVLSKEEICIAASFLFLLMEGNHRNRLFDKLADWQSVHPAHLETKLKLIFDKVISNLTLLSQRD